MLFVGAAAGAIWYNNKKLKEKAQKEKDAKDLAEANGIPVPAAESIKKQSEMATGEMLPPM